MLNGEERESDGERERWKRQLNKRGRDTKETVMESKRERNVSGEGERPRASRA